METARDEGDVGAMDAVLGVLDGAQVVDSSEVAPDPDVDTLFVTPTPEAHLSTSAAHGEYRTTSQAELDGVAPPEGEPVEGIPPPEGDHLDSIPRPSEEGGRIPEAPKLDFGETGPSKIDPQRYTPGNPEAAIQKAHYNEVMSSEVLAYRDRLEGSIDQLRERVNSLDEASMLPEGVNVIRYPNGQVLIELGGLPASIDAAQAQRAVRGADAKTIAVLFDDMERNFSDGERQTNPSSKMEVEEIFRDGKDTVRRGLDYKTDGSVAFMTDRITTEQRHYPWADEFTVKYTRPQRTVSRPVEAATTTRAGVAEIRYMEDTIQSLMEEYGLEA